MVKIIFLILIIILGVVSTGCDYIGDFSANTSASEQVDYSVEQIQIDLIGQALIINGAEVWVFGALSEYEEFEIIERKVQGNAVEYDVTMKLKDFATNTHFTADAFLVYEDIDGEWELISVVTKSFERLDDGQTYY